MAYEKVEPQTRIKGFEHRVVEFDEVVNTKYGIEAKPDDDYRSKSSCNLRRTKRLDQKEENQDGSRHSYHRPL